MNSVNLWHNRNKLSEVQALNNVGLEIKQGEYVSFFGPSGCGKTTLLFIIAGIGLPQEGEIFVQEKDIMRFTKNELAIYRQVGVGIVFQAFNLIPSLSVLGNVTLPMAFLGVSKRKRNEEGKKLLQRLGIENLATRYPYELSGGQQQRVGIARALANNPPIIVADEPLGNLDSENAEKVLTFLKELNEKDGRTVIMVTHEAWSLRDSDRIFFMKDGAIIKVESGRDEHIVEEITRHVAGGLTTKLGPAERSVRSLLHLLVRGYSEEELKRLEKFITQRVTGGMDSKTFQKMLDKPFQSGGVGLWKQRAAKFSHIIDGVMEERKAVERLLEELPQHSRQTSAYAVEDIRNWLLSDYEGSASYYQLARLDEVIDERIHSAITKEQVQQITHASKKESGLGFSFRESNWLADKLESIVTEKNKKELTETSSSVGIQSAPNHQDSN
jgi:putative ABC transport system ATP-binding protein